MIDFDLACIAQRLTAVREEIRRTAERVGRPEPLLLAATKTVPAPVIRYAIDTLGITDIGENRVQELLEKYDDIRDSGVNLHFIGRLQTNKVKYIVDKVCMIHSLDSLKLAEEIDRQAKKHGKTMDVLIEINSGREPNKGGIMPEDAETFLDQISGFSALRVRGMMTMAPVCSSGAEIQKYFRETSQLFIDISQKKPHNIINPILSMGMSDSYVTAIEEGTGIVRIGSAIFGKRT